MFPSTGCLRTRTPMQIVRDRGAQGSTNVQTLTQWCADQTRHRPHNIFSNSCQTWWWTFQFVCIKMCMNHNTFFLVKSCCCHAAFLLGNLHVNRSRKFSSSGALQDASSRQVLLVVFFSFASPLIHTGCVSPLLDLCRFSIFVLSSLRRTLCFLWDGWRWNLLFLVLDFLFRQSWLEVMIEPEDDNETLC